MIAAIVLAAGKGVRMKSALPKVLHPVAGRPMIAHVMDRLRDLAPERAAVVIGPDMTEVARAVRPTATVVQDRPLGTAHAAACARERMAGFRGDVLILFGDTPLLSAATLETALSARRGGGAPAVAALGFTPSDPAGYGRMVLGRDGSLEAIVEDRDASPDQRAIGLCNAGIMAVAGEHLFGLLEAVEAANAAGEYYLTDIVAAARARGLACAAVEAADGDDVRGVNTRAELAAAEAIMQARLRRAAMAGGATLLDPDTVYFSCDTELGRDVTVGPQVVFGGAVTVGDGAEIRAFSHIDGAEIEAGAVVGPFARLRPGTRIGRGAHIGNFVEVKAAEIEAGAKANHLSYIGDARVGEGANVGAGAITCNYDGFAKSRTEIGAGAFIGSNASLVAPLSVGAGAIVGAGSVITADVPADALAVERNGQRMKPGWAAAYRSRKRAGPAG